MSEEQIYICPKCGDDIEGARYSSHEGMVCGDCNDKIWKEDFPQEE